jgi:hypothetical protein
MSADDLGAWIGLVALVLCSGILLYMKSAFSSFRLTPLGRWLDAIGLVLIGLLVWDALGLFGAGPARGSRLAVDLLKVGVPVALVIVMFRYRHKVPWETRGMIYVVAVLATVTVTFLRRHA